MDCKIFFMFRGDPVYDWQGLQIAILNHKVDSTAQNT